MAQGHSNVPYLVTAVLALAVILLAWTGRDRFEPFGPGSTAPDFEAVSVEGDTVALEEYAGKVVLLNVWATWCPPCVEEMPSMERLYSALEREEDFEILAVSVDGRRRGQLGPLGRTAGDPAGFAESLGLSFPILLDPDAGILDDYQTVGLPESYVIGRDGKIYQRVSGPTDWDHPRHVEFIRRLLEQGA